MAAAFCCAPIYASPEPKTVVTGDKMQIIKDGEQVVFSGNALVKRGRDVLAADKLIENKKDKIIDAYGNVDFNSVTADSEPIRCLAGRGHYAMNLGVGRLWENRPMAIWQALTSTSPVTMQADVIDYDQKKGELDGEGAVNIVSSSGTISSPVVHFFQHEKKLVLVNGAFQPEVTYIQPDSTGRYRADSIVMWINDKKAVFTGNVWGRVLFKEQQQTK